MNVKTVFSLLVIFVLLFYLFNLISSLTTVITPISLYSIENEDDQTHKVTIEILNKNNNTIHKQNYTLLSKERISYRRIIQRNLPYFSPTLNWSEGIFTFNFTVDDIISDNITMDIDQWMTISVDLYSKGIPLKIQVTTA